jgi:predicted amino acid dehydrogenase
LYNKTALRVIVWLAACPTIIVIRAEMTEKPSLIADTALFPAFFVRG